MNFYKNYSVRNLVLLALATMVVIIILLCPLEPLYLHFKNHSSDSDITTPNNSSSKDELGRALQKANSSSKDKLGRALEKASMANKTLIITIVNKAYVDRNNDYGPSMLDLFLEGFWAGEGTRQLVGHLLVVTMDRGAHDRCRFRRLNCYRLADRVEDNDFAGEKFFMSDGFIKMMWKRTGFLLDVLNRGFSFIFSDTDVLWLRNPFPILMISSNETLDFQISTDSFYGNSSSEGNPINTGFYFVRSNEKTISLFQTWYDSRKNATGMKEQDVLGKLVWENIFGKLGVKAKFLDTLYFSGFCQDSRYVEQVTTVHANCCRGMVAKIEDLKMVLKDWKMRKNRSSGNFQWSNHTFCNNSWH